MTVWNHWVQWYLYFSVSQIFVRITWKVWILSSNAHKSTHKQNGACHFSFTEPGPSLEKFEPDSRLKTTWWKERTLYWEAGIRTPTDPDRDPGTPLFLSDLQNKEHYEWVSNDPSSSENIQIFNRQLTLKCWSPAGIFSHTHFQF